MTANLSFKNARIVLSDDVIEGSLSVRDGIIDSIDTSRGATGEDLEGDYLIPGLVELHTDHLESHYHPRPKVYWNAMAALQAHDAQIASSGITTVFDAVRIGSDADSEQNFGEHVGALMEAIDSGKRDGRLRADHFVHLRCEVPARDAREQFEANCDYEIVRLASLMDHTPGQRQFQTMDLFYAYYQGRSGRTDAQMKVFIAQRLEDQKNYAASNRAAILKRGKAIGLAFASHDDATVEHVDEARREGVVISEFPTTVTAAKAAREAGLSVLMGAPNIVRGGSHSGNISASDLAGEGLLDVLSSDYVPFSLVHAAFELPVRVPTVSLPEAIATVARNPAMAAGLTDRGEIVPGKRADLVRVTLQKGVPIIRSVWREGRRVI